MGNRYHLPSCHHTHYHHYYPLNDPQARVGGRAMQQQWTPPQYSDKMYDSDDDDGGGNENEGDDESGTGVELSWKHL